jgi:alcohol dehydrogenase
MKALVYHGPGQKAWEDVPDAAIQEPTDVVVRIDTTTICGTDLHILQGDVAAVTDGRILGHEAVGTVTEVGEAVKGFGVGDRVLVPAITKCGRCGYCARTSDCFPTPGSPMSRWFLRCVMLAATSCLARRNGVSRS